jgi:hypothetical protein
LPARRTPIPLDMIENAAQCFRFFSWTNPDSVEAFV